MSFMAAFYVGREMRLEPSRLGPLPCEEPQALACWDLMDQWSDLASCSQEGPDSPSGTASFRRLILGKRLRPKDGVLCLPERMPHI